MVISVCCCCDGDISLVFGVGPWMGPYRCTTLCEYGVLKPRCNVVLPSVPSFDEEEKPGVCGSSFWVLVCEIVMMVIPDRRFRRIEDKSPDMLKGKD